MIILLLQNKRVVSCADVCSLQDGQRIFEDGGYPGADEIMPLPEGQEFPFSYTKYRVDEHGDLIEIAPEPPVDYIVK